MKAIWPLLLLTACLAACATAPQPHENAPKPEPPRVEGEVREVRALPRPGEKIQELDEEAVLENAADNMFFVLRTQADLDAVRARFGLTGLFAEKGVDFDKDFIVGAIGERAAVKRNFRIYRALETPQNVEVQVISFRRQKLEREITPYVFVRYARINKPVHFFLNDALAQVENGAPLSQGRNTRVLTRDSLYYVYVPTNLKTPAPMVVLLHGSTTSADVYIEKLEAGAEELGVVLLALTNRNGYYWTEDHDYGAIYDAIHAVKARISIDESNLFLAGSSAGGHTSYPFGLKNRHLFKGFCSFCGRMNPAVPDDVVAAAKDMPICIIAGELDDMVPLKAIQPGRERLEKAGAKVTFHIVEGAGHSLMRDPKTAPLFYAWLKEQIAAPDARPHK